MLLERRTHDQQTHEKVFSTFSHQGNANQNSRDSISTEPTWRSSRKQTIYAVEDEGEKGTLIQYWQGCKLGQTPQKPIYRGLEKLKVEVL